MAFLSEWLYPSMLAAIVILAVVRITWAGFKWMAGAVSPPLISDAKDLIEKALWGLGLALVSYLVLVAINPALVRLKRPTPDFSSGNFICAATNLTFSSLNTCQQNCTNTACTSISKEQPKSPVAPTAQSTPSETPAATTLLSFACTYSDPNVSSNFNATYSSSDACLAQCKPVRVAGGDVCVNVGGGGASFQCFGSDIVDRGKMYTSSVECQSNCHNEALGTCAPSTP